MGWDGTGRRVCVCVRRGIGVKGYVECDESGG